MKKNLTILFLTCSLTLVLGHSVLPHAHLQNENLSLSSDEKSTLSFTELITLTLSYDLGANHLEEYNNSKPHQCPIIDFQKLESNMRRTGLLAVDFLSMHEFTAATNSEVSRQYFCKDIGLRAPPCMS